ncbi:MAG: corrinoid protein [Candidatus Eremiobacteraeota bacterium]|nr:corrinoid protein [Candidatus Eremiobacteraeota bacterium]
MDKNELYQKMYDAVLAGDKEKSVELAKESIKMGLDPRQTIENGYTPGIDKVGDLWEEGEYFLPELVMAAESTKAAIEVLKPELARKKETTPNIGTVIMGTVEGDIHDIGKTLVSSLLSAAGFKVIDLGADVPTDKFIEEAKKHKADIIGMSALLTTTMVNQKKVIEKLKEEGIRDRFRIMVGGAPVSRKWGNDIGADDAPMSAMEAVKSAKGLMKEKV